MSRRGQDLSSYGPAMLKLNPRRRQFVINICELGADQRTQCARMAGFKQSPNGYGLKRQANRLWYDPLVQEAIAEETRKRLRGSAPMALSVMQELALHGKPDNVRFLAARAILDRTGFHAAVEFHVKQPDLAQDPERLRRIEALAAKMNMPLEDLLGRRLSPPTIDANE